VKQKCPGPIMSVLIYEVECLYDVSVSEMTYTVSSGTLNPRIP